MIKYMQVKINIKGEITFKDFELLGGEETGSLLAKPHNIPIQHINKSTYNNKGYCFMIFSYCNDDERLKRIMGVKEHLKRVLRKDINNLTTTYNLIDSIKII